MVERARRTGVLALPHLRTETEPDSLAKEMKEAKSRVSDIIKADPATEAELFCSLGQQLKQPLTVRNTLSKEMEDLLAATPL